ncbi:MAG: hypothetical protein KDC71_18620, partial [Acidobacteria bacterium]|nr:hypothetical protein [Acidobacteriota bacterium]
MSKPTKTKVRVKRKRKTIRLPSIGSVGASPGFAEITEIKTGETLIRATGYGAGGVQNPQLCQVEDLSELRKKFPVLWVEVLGLG